MYRTKEPTKKRMDEKRRMILDVSAGVFSRKGYLGTTITDIVNAAGVSVGSVYFYFKNKEELFSEMYKNIAEEFNDTIFGVLDVERYPLQKNFTRVMMATLWMYQQKRDIAGLFLSDGCMSEKAVCGLESGRMAGFVADMTEWFARFKRHNGVNIPDERVAALIYASSYNALVGDWLSCDSGAPLTDSGFAFCVYNLQALGIAFEEEEIRTYIDEVLTELREKKE